jgi:hypothetical protein
MKKALFIFELFMFASAGYSQVLLTDNFDGNSVDTSKWTVTLPYGDSSVTENNGYLQVENRGRIASVNSFSGTYSVSGSLLLSNNQFSNSKIVLRSNGGSIGAAEMPGVAIQFQVRQDDAIQDQLSIFTIGAPSDETVSTSLTTPLNLDTWYDFTITDNGNLVQLFFNDSSTPTLALATEWSAGGMIGFYNREGDDAGSSISNDGIGRLDSITVTAIPEPASYSMFAGLLALGSIFVFKRRLFTLKNPAVL